MMTPYPPLPILVKAFHPGDIMKTLSLLAAAACSLLTGCIAVPVADHGMHVSGTVRSEGGHRHRGMRDRDGDGVPHRHDRRPRDHHRH